MLPFGWAECSVGCQVSERGFLLLEHVPAEWKEDIDKFLFLYRELPYDLNTPSQTETTAGVRLL
jgi:hypothetical protein